MATVSEPAAEDARPERERPAPMFPTDEREV